MNLRYIDRYGKMVLQQLASFVDGQGEPQLNCWQDVPIHKEPEQQKPMEFWILKDRVNSKIEVKDYEPSFVHEYNNCFHVTEIPKGYKLISRYELCEALYPKYLNNMSLEEVLKELGFE